MKKLLLYFPLPILSFLIYQLVWSEDTVYTLLLGLLLGVNLTVLWVKYNGR